MVTAPKIEVPTLDPLRQLLAEDIDQVNACILGHIQTDIPLITDLATYLFTSGGKRIRALLTLAAARLCEISSAAHIPLATSIEFIHAATLLHDDVVDGSALRRGVKTANEVWSNQACILVGDFLFSYAFELILRAENFDILKAISKASTSLAKGELAQLSLGRNINLTRAQYLEVITSKTACLFEAACHAGALSAGSQRGQAEALKNFGFNLGIAFQLIDDLLDYTAKETELGKAIGDDFREGKVTLPVILARESAGSEDLTFWERTLENLDQREGDFEAALEIMTQHNALSNVYKMAETYVAKALQHLGVFPESPIKSALEETALFTLQRYH